MITVIFSLLGSDERKEHVESNLDRVDKDQTVLSGDELEIDGMHNRPDLPTSLACTKEIGLDLVDNGTDRVSVAESQVGEKDRHKERTPEQLVNTNLEGDVLCFGSFNFRVEPVVKEVSRRPVVDETKDTEGDESLHVKGTTGDKDLKRQANSA